MEVFNMLKRFLAKRTNAVSRRINCL
jgi:hypothetical protein